MWAVVSNWKGQLTFHRWYLSHRPAGLDEYEMYPVGTPGTWTKICAERATHFHIVKVVEHSCSERVLNSVDYCGHLFREGETPKRA